MKKGTMGRSEAGDGDLVYLEPCRPARHAAEAAGIDAADPDGMIRSALAGLGDPQTCAEDLFVAWIMALPPGADEAGAARILLAAYLPGRREPLAALGRRIAALLEEAGKVGGAGGESAVQSGAARSGRSCPCRPSARRRVLRGFEG